MASLHTQRSDLKPAARNCFSFLNLVQNKNSTQCNGILISNIKQATQTHIQFTNVTFPI